MTIDYTSINSTDDSTLSIAFLPTGDAIPSSDLDEANSVFVDVIKIMRLALDEPDFDFWKLLGWTLVSYHWVVLYNFGQIAPTSYSLIQNNPSNPALTQGHFYFNGFGTPNFSDPIQYPPTNNIFYNETLFTIYCEYLNSTLLPLAGKFGVNVALQAFLPITDQNRLQAVPTTFLTSYSCTQYQIKGWISLVVSVITADYALITGAYSFAIFIAAKCTWFTKGDPEQEMELLLNPTHNAS